MTLLDSGVALNILAVSGFKKVFRSNSIGVPKIIDVHLARHETSDEGTSFIYVIHFFR